MKRLKLARYGGLSPVKQTHYTSDFNEMSYHGAPQKYGIYAFHWPYIDWWMLSAGDTGKLKPYYNTDTDEDIKYKNKHERLTHSYKKFSVGEGYIWTHLDCGSKAVDWRGSWEKVHIDDFLPIFKKHYSQVTKEYWQVGKDWNLSTKPTYTCKAPYKMFCKDHLEIFIPRGTKLSSF